MKFGVEITERDCAWLPGRGITVASALDFGAAWAAEAQAHLNLQQTAVSDSFPSRAVQKLQLKHPVKRVPPLSISTQRC